MLGWMALIVRPSFSGSVVVQVLPPSLLRSKCTVHLLGLSAVSLLVGQRMIAVGELHRLVLDRAENAVGQTRAAHQVLPPSVEVLQHRPTSARTRADFVEEHQRPGLRLEQHGIPARDAACRRPARHWRLRPARVHLPFAERASQMPTSGLPSAVPPNHAASESAPWSRRSSWRGTTERARFRR